MKLPLYLKVSLALTGCLVAWTLFHGDTSTGVSRNPQTAPAIVHTGNVKTPSAMPAGSGELADLFPVYAKPATQTTGSTATAIPEVYFPFQLAGIWLSERQKIIIITDGMRSWLLCDKCGRPGFTQAGDVLNADWKLQSIEPEFLKFEAMSGHAEKRLDLNSLKIK